MNLLRRKIPPCSSAQEIRLPATFLRGGHGLPGYNRSMQNLLHNLNEEQLAAVTLPSQSALILAGEGSGKTRVLTTRIAWLIQTGQILPAGILAVTFTN